MIPVLCALLCACSAPARGPEGGAGEARPERKRAKAALRAEPDLRFDAQGNLKPGSLHASWLEIPSGFSERPGSTAHLSAYDATGLPIAKVREFLEARLLPERVVYPLHGMSFREALPRHTQLTMAPLNVLLVELDRSTRQLRLIVEDLTPPATKPLSVDQAAQALAHDRKHVE
ncbi:MAG: hypothetical protein JWN04_4297 [Myxococcaceae bacterium]|nr:hypothetical protein [Myxococcaceae bacterium]